jgi:LPS-assembly protein
MALPKKSRIVIASIITSCSFAPFVFAESKNAYNTLAEQLGWVSSPVNNCGGYYVDQSFTFPVNIEKPNAVEITSNQGLIAQRGTSSLEGRVTITRQGQQITANKAYLYRDPQTYKLLTAEMVGDVNLREPNTLIVGKSGRY